jgi:uncharacterized repeat protein (TIGR03837 family)
MMSSIKQWDIFCKIVDNFGDIGVCWRLAKQLHTEYQLDICLWIDDLRVAQQLIPNLNPELRSQHVDGIHIQHWQTHIPFKQAAEVVIEAFGCELPSNYLALMHAETTWINLEYLSAEAWVADFHGRHSKHGALTRHFFFPGFSAASGGLLREHNIVTHNQILAKDIERQAFFQHLHIAPATDDALKVSLFCYPNAPVHPLLHAMAKGSQPIQCFVPSTGILPKIAALFDEITLNVGDQRTDKNLTLTILPFLSQTDYDRLLASCDINFVRGEDSWIRAIWSGKPFIWQPYWQTENTHIKKLEAFLALLDPHADSLTLQANQALHWSWSNNALKPETWRKYLQYLNALQQLYARQSAELATLPDLASNLVSFIEKLRTNKI